KSTVEEEGMRKNFDFPDLLRVKRDGEELTAEEINWIIKEVVNKSADDCQIGALLMAIYLNGFTDQETMDLTKAMISSGEQLKWNAEWEDLLVDKHSTGGCGDKVSIALAPALAACGFKVPMLSGRGLEHTGGTLDKLESIPGFNVQISNEEMHTALVKAGCFISGPTPSIAPGDRELYKRRDVTATVDSIPLIAGSIISKKVAAGTKVLIMDVKAGNAAFFKTVDSARELISVSAGLGVQTQAALTRMDAPIGRSIGNSLEVVEAIECLKGEGTCDLDELVTTFGGMILHMKGRTETLDEGKKMTMEKLQNGEALKKFETMLICQGVDRNTADIICNGNMRSVLPKVPENQVTVIRSCEPGFIGKLDAMLIARASWKLGAGRSKADEQIDYRVGIILLRVVGDFVNKGVGIMEVHHNTPELNKEIQMLLEDSIIMTKDKVEPVSLIIDIVKE
ncbi:hypothetical protein L9F63_000767, partial [Diploptera punctata]